MSIGGILALPLIGLALVFNKEIATFLGVLTFAQATTGGGGGEVPFDESLAGKTADTTFGTQALEN